MWHLGNQSLLGLDIQSWQLNLLQLRKNKNEYIVEQALVAHLEEAIFQENRITNWEYLYISLTGLLKSLGIKTTTVALSLPINLVKTGCIQVASGLAEEAIVAEIMASQQHDLFGREDGICMDYQTRLSREDHITEVDFVMTEKKYVNEYVSFIAKTGLTPKILDVDIYALQRAVLYADQQAQLNLQNFTLIHVANKKVFFINIKNKKIINHYAWNLNETNLSMKEFLQQELLPMLPANASDLVICASNEISSVFKSILDCYKNKVTYLNPLQFIKNDSLSKENTSDFLVALGLALREVPKW